MGLKQQYRSPTGEWEAREAFASYTIDLVQGLKVSGLSVTPPLPKSNVKHIHGNDLFTLDNVARSLEAALAKRKVTER